MSNPWFRMYSELAFDPKVQVLTEALQRRYVMALCLHCDNKLKNRPDDEIALSLRVTLDEWKETKETLINRGLLSQELEPTGWQKRQYISDIKDSTAAERQKRYRDRKRNAPVTSRLPEADTDTDTDTEAEKKDVGSARKETRSDQPIKKSKVSRATRLPEDWDLPQEWGDWAETKGLSGDEIITQAEKFRARQKSKGASYIDWESTWHTWILNYIEWGAKNVQAKSKY